ncbi:MAG: class I SAM-dependent methyltransferase [Vicinamibacterales bacterium]
MTVIVPARGTERLARTSDLPLTLCPAPAGLADGAVAVLTTARHVPLGVAVLDRASGLWRVMSRADEPHRAPDAAWAEDRIARAARLRASFGLDGPEAAYRLLNGAGDGTPGVIADLYAGWAVVAAAADGLVAAATGIAGALVARGSCRGAVVKLRARGRPADGGPVATVGEAPPARLEVREGPWRFEVHLTPGVNVGLFTDMREERARIAGLARGRHVLNLFAYTGTLSVAAAAGGAASVTSVDLSEGVLGWARDHLAMNGLDAGRHRTAARDAATFVAEAAARGERFDLILIDPPSYSAARGAPFAIDRDYPPLVSAAAGLVPPGGDLWLASNTRGFPLAGTTFAALTAAGRRASVVAQGGLPPDYPTELADADARYLQTCLLRLA